MDSLSAAESSPNTRNDESTKGTAPKKSKKKKSVSVSEAERIGLLSSAASATLGIEREEKHALFQHCYEALKPGPFFKTIVYLYGERKLFVFFMLHFVATMIIWSHFALIKWEEQKEKVPEGATYYWLKRIAPPLEFGSMHAILFQMALIPLTMSRYSIASLSQSFLNRFVPLNRSLRIHIHLGYTMVGIVFWATIFFFIFFGTLCADGDEAFCDKFTSEIMCTGYGILGSLLIIGGTSYFRNNIPYEIFYAIHHLVFAMYIITIAHTVDDVQRNNERSRSQTFKWFSTTILYYFCDRAAMYVIHRYKTRILASKSVEGSDGSRMLLIKIRRPTLFQFKPGQYAFLKVSSIDRHWHPFSIASCSSDDNLEFYIEVFESTSWTGKLWTLLNEHKTNEGRSERTYIEVMGPYGTSFMTSESHFSHGLAVGAGTGIVPILSLFKHHARHIMRLSPKTHLQILQENSKKVMKIELEREKRKSSMFRLCLSTCSSAKKDVSDKKTNADRLRDRIHESAVFSKLTTEDDVKSTLENDIRKLANRATKSLYGVVFMGILTTIGVSLMGLTISWSTLPIDVYPGMVTILQFLTVAFQTCFAFAALFVWDKNSLVAFLDVGTCIIAGLADVYYFFIYEEHGMLRAVEVTTFSLLIGYMVARLWTNAVSQRHNSWQHAPGGDENRSMECLKIVWVSRSAPLIAEILPDIDEVWQDILKTWKKDDALKVIEFSVHCTDKDEASQVSLVKAISNTLLFQEGFVRFGRPDFDQLLRSHIINLTDERRSSNSLFAFCGSPSLARHLHALKVKNDMTAAIAGYKQHQMEFISESYGGSSRKKRNEGLLEKKSSRYQVDIATNLSASSATGDEAYLSEFCNELERDTEQSTNYARAG